MTKNELEKEIEKLSISCFAVEEKLAKFKTKSTYRTLKFVLTDIRRRIDAVGVILKLEEK